MHLTLLGYLMTKLLSVILLAILMAACNGDSSGHSESAPMVTPSDSASTNTGQPAPCKNVAASAYDPTADLSLSQTGADFVVSNNNACGNIYIWEWMTAISGSYSSWIDPVPVNQYLAPSQSINIHIDATHPGAKPIVIFSDTTGAAFIYIDTVGEKYASSDHISAPVLLLDYRHTYSAEMPEPFLPNHDIDFAGTETRTNGCFGFSWLDKYNGKFQIAQQANGSQNFCAVYNIETNAIGGGTSMHPPVRYFVADTSKIGYTPPLNTWQFIWMIDSVN